MGADTGVTGCVLRGVCFAVTFLGTSDLSDLSEGMPSTEYHSAVSAILTAGIGLLYWLLHHYLYCLFFLCTSSSSSFDV